MKFSVTFDICSDTRTDLIDFLKGMESSHGISDIQVRALGADDSADDYNPDLECRQIPDGSWVIYLDGEPQRMGIPPMEMEEEGNYRLKLIKAVAYADTFDEFQDAQKELFLNLLLLALGDHSTFPTEVEAQRMLTLIVGHYSRPNMIFPAEYKEALLAGMDVPGVEMPGMSDEIEN